MMRGALCAAALAAVLAGCAERPQVVCDASVDRQALNQCAGRTAGLAQFASAMDASADLQQALRARADALNVAARSCAVRDGAASGSVLFRDQTIEMVAHEREIAQIRSLYQQSLRDRFGAFDRGLVPVAAFSPPELAGCDRFIVE